MVNRRIFTCEALPCLSSESESYERIREGARRRRGHREDRYLSIATMQETL